METTPGTTTIARFAAEAASLPSDEFAFRVPLHVLLGEAADQVRFIEQRWEPRRDANGAAVLPGLSSIGPRFPRALAEEITALAEAAHAAHFAYLVCVEPDGAGGLTARGRELLEELAAVLAYHADDGADDEKDQRLAALEDAHRNDPESVDALASQLEDYAALARSYSDEILGLGGFERETIRQAQETVAALRALPARPALSSETRQKLALRNRLLTLLAGRIARVRSAARFVFRAHPAVVREATSAFERQRRAASRRRAAVEASPSGDDAWSQPAGD